MSHSLANRVSRHLHSIIQSSYKPNHNKPEAEKNKSSYAYCNPSFAYMSHVILDFSTRSIKVSHPRI